LRKISYQSGIHKEPYFVRLLMQHNHETLTNARIKIDRSGSQVFRQEMKRYLRQQLGSGKIQSLKFADPRRDNLVQLADMAAGAIARSYREDGRARHDRWRLALQPKIEDIWDFQ